MVDNDCRYLVRDKGASPKDLEDVTKFLQLVSALCNIFR